MDKVNDFKLAVTAVVALLTSLWGWFGWLVVLFVGCMAVDYHHRHRSSNAPRRVVEQVGTRRHLSQDRLSYCSNGGRCG